MARQNDHIRAEELMSAYLDKRMTAEEKNFFERHIASCADCHAQLEATRSMVTALRAMPLVKAPRSFVLPREMAKQPKRSFMSLYPALRLATVVAAMAFAILFASDLLIVRSGGGAAQQFIPAAAPAPMEMQAPTAGRQIAPTSEPAAAEAASGVAVAPTEPAAPPADASAKMSETTVMTDSAAMSVMTATPAPTATAEVVMRAQTTGEAIPGPAEPAAGRPNAYAPDQSVGANPVATSPAVDPLRAIEIALLTLAIVLGIATLIVRRKQV